MVTTINVRRRDFTLTGSYTLGFSRSYDDRENGGFSSANYVDAFNLQNEYNWSNIDQRHQVAANGVFFLPKGFEVTTTMRYNSGRPYSPRTNVDSNNDGIINDRPVSTAASFDGTRPGITALRIRAPGFRKRSRCRARRESSLFLRNSSTCSISRTSRSARRR